MVTGLFYGGASQLPARVIGVLVNLCWVLPTAYGFFWVVGRLLGNRVSAHSEFVGLDLPEMGAAPATSHRIRKSPKAASFFRCLLSRAPRWFRRAG